MCHNHSTAPAGSQSQIDVFVALGANLPGPEGQSPRATCTAALAALAALPGLRLVAASPWYRSPAWPPGSGAPDYVNGLARLRGPVPDPAALLAALHAIEARFGRHRSVANAPRSLDLDLIAVGDLIRPGPDPVLPHPRAQDRRFVLAPLAEVAPGWVHPALGRPVEALLAGLAPDGTAPLERDALRR
jgi:2-amino-4-hydroxy-6-hydroxymethyldihydropteridine diphosphokinase